METVRPALTLLAAFSLLLGLGYPAVVTVVAQAAFPAQANGSLVVEAGRAVASDLIGQPFADPGLFWGRASAASNLGPSNPALVDAVRSRVAALRAADPGNRAPVPVDLVTASGSGLDPHVSPAAALFQAGRVARARGLPEAEVRALVARVVEGPTFGCLGEARVNVVRLNLALGRLRRSE